MISRQTEMRQLRYAFCDVSHYMEDGETWSARRRVKCCRQLWLSDRQLTAVTRLHEIVNSATNCRWSRHRLRRVGHQLPRPAPLRRTIAKRASRESAQCSLRIEDANNNLRPFWLYQLKRYWRFITDTIHMLISTNRNYSTF